MRTLPGAPHVVCCGLTTLDLIYDVDAPPSANAKVVARDLLIDAGGPAAKAARTIRALGGTASLVTALGEGPLAPVLRAVLAGLEIEDLAPPAFRPAVSTVMVTGVERAVVSVNATQLSSAAQPRSRSGFGALLVDGHLMDAAITLATAARRAGIPVVFDGGSWKPGTERLLPHVDVAAVSADFTFPGGGDVLEGLVEAGVAIALRTDGPRPVEVRTPTARLTVEVPATTVVDTLGAGDVFHGALSLEIARGTAVRAAVASAAAAASMSVAHRGVLGWCQASASAEA